jgi:EAL domain-containing protein (putative c-di-GMP-specific phosphodiesterase class I)
MAGGIFWAFMILLYLASTLYHGLPIGKVKHCFRIIEHSAIFILIAVTAEGVETEGQMDFLQKEKCKEAQGFYLSRPMATQEAERFLYEYGTMKAASAK